MRKKVLAEALGQPMFPISQVQTLRPYIADVGTEIIYLCYSNKVIRVVERITIEDGENGSKIYKTDHATGRWEDRADLNYAPINDELYTND